MVGLGSERNRRAERAGVERGAAALFSLPHFDLTDAYVNGHHGEHRRLPELVRTGPAEWRFVWKPFDALRYADRRVSHEPVPDNSPLTATGRFLAVESTPVCAGIIGLSAVSIARGSN